MTTRRAMASSEHESLEAEPSEARLARAMGLLVFATLVLLLVSPGLDPDLFWHLETGDLIANDGVVSADPFSWTFPGRDWVMHEWLSELAMSATVMEVGFTGLPLVFAVIMAGAWTALFFAMRGSVTVRAGIVVLAAVAAAPITSVRPATLTYALLVLTAIIVDWVGLERVDPRWSLLLVPMMALWVNLHGGFLVGLVYPLVVLAGDLVDRRLHRNRLLSDPAARWLGVAVVGTAMAGVINPRGLGAYTFAIDSFFNPSFDVIEEWQATDFSLPQVWPWVALVLVGAVGLIRARRVSAGSILLFVGALAAGVMSYRHVAVHAIVAAPVVIATFRATRPVKLPTRAVIGVAIVVGAVAVWEASITYRFWETAVPRFYPVAAVEFLEEEGISTSQMFNTYGFGGWLIRNEISTFVDGRADMFPPQFVLDAVAAQRGSAEWEDLFAEYGVEVALLRPSDGLSDRLVDSGDWQLVYQDSVAVVFIPAAGQ